MRRKHKTTKAEAERMLWHAMEHLGSLHLDQSLPVYSESVDTIIKALKVVIAEQPRSC